MATYRLISSNSHIIEPADLWQERIDRPFRDRAPHLVHEAEADQWVCGRGQIRGDRDQSTSGGAV